MKKDEGPRKKRVEKPKSKPGVAETLIWLETAWSEVSSVVNTAFLGSKNKKNLRQLTKSDVSDLENLKLSVLTNIGLFSDVNEDSIYQTILSGQNTPAEFQQALASKNISTTNLSIDDYRKHVLGSYLEFLLS